ncbi:hypothetical protein GQ457_10G004230 [Hibiscus cannabinus]
MGCVASTDSRPLVSYKSMVIGGNDPQSDDNHIDLDDDDIDPLVSYKSMVIGGNDPQSLMNCIYGIWKPSHPIKLMYIESDYYLVKFSDPGDYLKVLNKGPWTIFGHYISVEPWSIDFQQSQVSPSHLMA